METTSPSELIEVQNIISIRNDDRPLSHINKDYPFSLPAIKKIVYGLSHFHILFPNIRECMFKRMSKCPKVLKTQKKVDLLTEKDLELIRNSIDAGDDIGIYRKYRIRGKYYSYLREDRKYYDMVEAAVEFHVRMHEHYLDFYLKEQALKKVAKPRKRKTLEERHPKITDEIVWLIRNDYSPITTISKKYGVPSPTVEHIIYNTGWKHLPYLSFDDQIKVRYGNERTRSIGSRKIRKRIESLTQDDYKYIRDSNLNLSELVVKYKIPHAYMQEIIDGTDFTGIT